jgi:hypothetical protein
MYVYTYTYIHIYIYTGYYDTLPLTRDDKNIGLQKAISSKSLSFSSKADLYSPSDDIEVYMYVYKHTLICI